RTVVADVADTVAVGVVLLGIGDRGAVVLAVGYAVAVGVVRWAHLAGIAHAVAVGIALVGVRDCRAGVGGVGYAVAVAVGLAGGVERVHGDHRVEVEAREPCQRRLQLARVDADEARGVETDRREIEGVPAGPGGLDESGAARHADQVRD